LTKENDKRLFFWDEMMRIGDSVRKYLTDFFYSSMMGDYGKLSMEKISA
jgi:hypothetical protein